MQKFNRVIPRRVRLIFKSGHVEVIEVPDNAEITWNVVGGEITELDIPGAKGNQGAYINLEEVAALFVLKKERF